MIIIDIMIVAGVIWCWYQGILEELADKIISWIEEDEEGDER